MWWYSIWYSALFIYWQKTEMYVAMHACSICIYNNIHTHRPRACVILHRRALLLYMLLALATACTCIVHYAYCTQLCYIATTYSMHCSYIDVNIKDKCLEARWLYIYYQLLYSVHGACIVWLSSSCTYAMHETYNLLFFFLTIGFI